MSKGSARRPGEGYDDGFDRIFGKKERKDPPEEPFEPFGEIQRVWVSVQGRDGSVWKHYPDGDK